MKGPPWERVKDVCLGALELPGSERPKYLDRACEGDPELRREAESLLAQYDPDFLEDPLVTLDPIEPGEDVPGHPQRIGPYRIVRPVGRGGMGEVLLAVQEGEGFERPVAIKLILSGMATTDVLERFRLERRILASLHHPNLARLIDGGATDDGRPYFVMEFVEGLPITEYCDRNALSVTERLRLFMSVCDAVHHAHQSLVVHRDIKPGNILVTSEGMAKLLDFGIGKVLDPSPDGVPDRTAATRRVLTPEYAAPEQVRGGVITTATDVHGLGVLLYELLTGRHPFSSEASTPEELDRAVVETTASAPSTVVTDEDAPASPSEVARLRGTVPGRLRRRLRGDLDNIILQALRKEPERRYPSAEAMRADVERHLDGRPVRARPDSLAYRASKFAVRNPWGLVAASFALVAVGVSIVVPWQQNRRLTDERDKALAVQGFLLEAFGTTGGDESIGARDLLDLQAGRADSLYADRPELHARMLLVLADAYDRLGLYADALPLAERALSLYQDRHEGDHTDVATALNTSGWALHRAGRGEEGARRLEDAVDMRERLGRSERGRLARSLNDLGVVREGLGQYQEAVVLHRRALDVRRSVLGDSDLATGVSANNLSTALYRVGDTDGAIREGELALELLRGSVGPEHQRTIIVQSNLAALKVARGDFEAAVVDYQALLAVQTRLQGESHPVTNSVRRGLGTSLLRLERWDEAERMFSDAKSLEFGEGTSELHTRMIAEFALGIRKQ